METYLLANTVLNMGADRRMRIRPMKLQKLMYFACGLHAAYKEEWLISDDFYAYPYGPVEVGTYEYFRHYRANPIASFMYDKHIVNPKEEANRDIYEVVRLVFAHYGDRDDFTLSDITHEKDGPWMTTFQEKPKSIIPRGIIMQYYKGKLGKEFPSSI